MASLHPHAKRETAYKLALTSGTVTLPKGDHQICMASLNFWMQLRQQTAGSEANDEVITDALEKLSHLWKRHHPPKSRSRPNPRARSSTRKIKVDETDCMALLTVEMGVAECLKESEGVQLPAELAR